MRVLQFSGGKDSLACLLKEREQGLLSTTHVVWVNTGACLPEQLELMDKVRAMCPNFHEVQTDQEKQVAEFGYPVDILPLRNMVDLQPFTGERLRLQSFMNCCTTNIMRPLHEYTLGLGATVIIRGQKACDQQKGPFKDGDVVEGITYHFPLEKWTDQEVIDYVRPSGLLPDHYRTGNTSLDCWNCTAHLHENSFKAPYLMAHHPEKAKELRRRLLEIHNEITQEMEHLEAAYG